MKQTIIKCMLLSVFGVNVALGTDINFTNTTKYPAQITVIYGGCKPDRDVDVGPGSTIQIPAGWCMIAEIAASVFVPGLVMPATATPYTSSGTGYRTFKLIQNYNGTFSVIRP